MTQDKDPHRAWAVVADCQVMKQLSWRDLGPAQNHVEKMPSNTQLD